ncbi:hypothetical protein [Goodfellowiella coeruleoviolacea]|uniref:hypothetical protein n=1 Tax=Goodfellowiella coeruleoviolacea TaxID=334858 RepID=UPI0020A2B152|nr:hypothetical protein [Goodfellowiella coeruleoviolacea]
MIASGACGDEVVAAAPDLILVSSVTDEQVLGQLRQVQPATVVTGLVSATR